MSSPPFSVHAASDSKPSETTTMQHAVTTIDSDAIVAPAPCNVGMEQSMPRGRYQRGRIISRGKKRKVWVGIFREDRMKPDGTIHRARRSIVLGTVKHVSKLQAIEALRPYLDAVNLVAMAKPKAGRTLKNFVEEWKHNVAPTLKPSTVRAAESHLRTHILPTMGDMPLTAINTRNVQAFISALTAKGLTRKSCDTCCRHFLVWSRRQRRGDTFRLYLTGLLFLYHAKARRRKNASSPLSR